MSQPPDDTGLDELGGFCVTYIVEDGASTVTESGLQQFDDQRRLVRQERDLGNDGTVSSVRVTTFDDVAGTYITVIDADLDDDGRFEDRTQTVANRANDLAVSIERDIDGDGVLDTELVTLTTTVDGDPTEQTLAYTKGIAERWFRSFDSARRLTSYERDFGDDGSVDQRSSTTYDDDARIATTQSDFDADGTVDAVVEIERDEEGRVAARRTDSPIGPPYEFVETWVYEGGLLITQHQEVDLGVTTWTYTYDGAGRPLRTVATNGFTTTYTVVDCTPR